jgi:hypothetical protein
MKKSFFVLLTLPFVLPACSNMTNQLNQPNKPTAMSTHSVLLEGCESTTPGVQYNFYRGTEPHQESTTPLNITPLSTCSYRDLTVENGDTYYYTAKAILLGQLSDASDEVIVVIPPE